MTNGSSQGLFVIVAVVIFGIFVAISDVIFRDTLQPSLANIFKDSVENSAIHLKQNFIKSKSLRLMPSENINHWYNSKKGGLSSKHFNLEITNYVGDVIFSFDYEILGDLRNTPHMERGGSFEKQRSIWLQIITSTNYDNHIIEGERISLLNLEIYSPDISKTGKGTVSKRFTLKENNKDAMGIGLHGFGDTIPRDGYLEIKNMRLSIAE